MQKPQTTKAASAIGHLRMADDWDGFVEKWKPEFGSRLEHQRSARTIRYPHTNNKN